MLGDATGVVLIGGKHCEQRMLLAIVVSSFVLASAECEGEQRLSGEVHNGNITLLPVSFLVAFLDLSLSMLILLIPATQ